MGASNTTKFFDNLSDSLGKSFNHDGVNRPDDCCMSDKAILYAADELGDNELHEFTGHLQHCRFCVDLILDLRMAEQESRESTGQIIEVLPALAQAVHESSSKQPAQPLTRNLADTISKALACLISPKLLVPLATACLVFFIVQSGFKDTDTIRQHMVLRSRVEMPGQNTEQPAKLPSMSHENEESTMGATMEKHDKSEPQETLYSMAPSLELGPETPVPAKKRKKKRVPRTALERLNLDRLKLVGIIRAPDGTKAIVEDHTGKGHVLTVGTYIGPNNGRVIGIEKNIVIIAEEIMDASGKIKVKEFVLKLHN